MTPLYIYNGKILIKNNALAASSNCCCDNRGCCLIDGQYDEIYTTQESCEACTTINYNCYEELQTQCNGECPSGATPLEDLVSLEFSGCFGSGGSATLDIGCGTILSGTITDGGNGYALPGRTEPTLTASVNGTGNGAELSVSLLQSQDGCGIDFWQVDSMSVTSSGTGYTEGDPIIISIGSGDTQADKAVANVNVNQGGEVTGATIFIQGAYYHEDTSLQSYVDNVLVNIVETTFPGGNGADIAAIVDDNPNSANFGKIIGVDVIDGGNGYAKLCSQTTQVESCDNCPTVGSISPPEYSTCTPNSEDPCGTWTDPCPCGGEEMCITIQHSQDASGDPSGACQPGGTYFLETIQIPSSCKGSVQVHITGIQDDDLLIDGVSINEPCTPIVPEDSFVDHTFITNADSFTISVTNNYIGTVGYDLTICFSYPPE